MSETQHCVRCEQLARDLDFYKRELTNLLVKQNRDHRWRCGICFASADKPEDIVHLGDCILLGQ